MQLKFLISSETSREQSTCSEQKTSCLHVKSFFKGRLPGGDREWNLRDNTASNNWVVVFPNAAAMLFLKKTHLFCAYIQFNSHFIISGKLNHTHFDNVQENLI